MGDYEDEIEMIAVLSIGEHVRRTHFKFRNVEDNETQINATDMDYDSEDSIFTGVVCKSDTPQIDAIDMDYDSEDSIFTGVFCKSDTPVFNIIFRSKNGKAVDFKNDVTEFKGTNRYIPTKRYCFIKCITYLTGWDHMKTYLEFIGTTNEDQL